MIDITAKDFESKIKDLISGKTSRVKLAAELRTDIRALTNKIIRDISINNPDLYLEYIKKYPYKQKERDDLDFEAMVIEMIKERTLTVDVANKYKVGVRTIQRKVNKLEKENPYLFEIYKKVKSSNKNNIPLSMELERQIAQLVRRPVRVNEQNSTRKKHLEEIERIFNNRCNFLSKQEAAESMGTTMNRIYKSLNELYRIRIEENYSNMGQSFRENLKVVETGVKLEEDDTIEEVTTVEDDIKTVIKGKGEVR